MSDSFVARIWRERDRPGWRLFGVSMATLAVAMVLALFSAAVAQEGRIRWHGRGFRCIRAGRLGGRFLRAGAGAAHQPSVDQTALSNRLQAESRRNRLPRSSPNPDTRCDQYRQQSSFSSLGCLIAGILISWFLSWAVLSGIEMRLELPDRLFAEQPVLATVELRNEKEHWPSLSIRVQGDDTEARAGEILVQPVYFPYIPRHSSARQKVQLVFPRRGVYRQDAFSIRTRFPFGLFDKGHRVDSPVEVVVYPHIEPAEQTYEILPLISGEMASFYRGRGHDLHSIRQYQPQDSARFVDWKISAKTGSLKVREYSREDERRLMLVLDPLVGPPRANLGKLGEAEHSEHFERAVSLAASIAWHFQEINAVMQFRTDRMVTPMAPAGEIIYEILRELAFIQPDTSESGGGFFDELAAETEVFKIVLTRREQRSIPSQLWSSSYFIFFDSI